MGMTTGMVAGVQQEVLTNNHLQSSLMTLPILPISLLPNRNFCHVPAVLGQGIKSP